MIRRCILKPPPAERRPDPIDRMRLLNLYVLCRDGDETYIAELADLLLSFGPPTSLPAYRFSLSHEIEDAEDAIRLLLGDDEGSAA